MTEDSSRGKTVRSRTDTSIIPLPKLEGPDELTTMNFKVPEKFHYEFKLYAVQHNLSMVDLLQLSFQHFKAQKKR